MPGCFHSSEQPDEGRTFRPRTMLETADQPNDNGKSKKRHNRGRRKSAIHTRSTRRDGTHALSHRRLRRHQRGGHPSRVRGKQWQLVLLLQNERRPAASRVGPVCRAAPPGRAGPGVRTRAGPDRARPERVLPVVFPYALARHPSPTPRASRRGLSPNASLSPPPQAPRGASARAATARWASGTR